MWFGAKLRKESTIIPIFKPHTALILSIYILPLAIYGTKSRQMSHILLGWLSVSSGLFTEILKQETNKHWRWGTPLHTAWRFNMHYKPQALVARTTPLFSNFLFTNLFSIKFLYFFIISSLFPYFNLFVSKFIQSYVNIKLHVSTLYRY